MRDLENKEMVPDTNFPRHQFAGAWCGIQKAHKHFRHHMYRMHGQEQFFNVKTSRSDTRVMKRQGDEDGQRVIYYRTPK
ncbi:MAG: hypothetical protein Q8R25_02110 [bacterium]|nr:hypothetical protein [bacterium]